MEIDKDVKWDGEKPSPEQAKELLAQWAETPPPKPSYLVRLARETAQPLHWSRTYRAGLLLGSAALFFVIGLLAPLVLTLGALGVWLGWQMGVSSGYFSAQWEILEKGRAASIRALEGIASEESSDD